MILQGILFGLVCAVCQSLCYVYSRRFVARVDSRPSVLFGLSHVWMGLFCVVLLPFCWTPRAVHVSTYMLPLAASCVFYLLGQVGLFHAVRRTNPSRVSPLLGLKILILAVITVVFMSETVTPLQWGAVGIAVTAAVALNYSGGALPKSALLVILGTCLGYALSDIYILKSLEILAPARDFKGIAFACCVSYILCAVVGVAVVFFGSKSEWTWAEWRLSLPVAVTWLIAMFALFACFAMLGVVFGNIIQSLRGPLSVFIGALIAHRGHEHLEKKLDRWTLVRRVAAAGLMCVAIGIFARERKRVQTLPAPPPDKVRQDSGVVPRALSQNCIGRNARL